jgi:hypothetical protein
MNLLLKLVGFLLLGLLVQTGSYAAGSPSDKQYFQVGINVGGSRISPGIDSQDFDFEVDQDTDTAYKVHIGYSWSPQWAVDLNYFNFGEASLLQGDGTRNQLAFSGSGLFASYSLLQSKVPFKPYLKFGVGTVSWDIDSTKNTESSALVLSKTFENRFLLGFGAEKYLWNKWALRSDADVFSSEVYMFSLGIQKAISNQL